MLMQLIAILIVGTVQTSTAFSQSIVPDKKVDSCYCFGAAKTKEIVKSFYKNLECDSTRADLNKIIHNQKAQIGIQDSINCATETKSSICESQLALQKEQVTARDEQLKIVHKQKRREKLGLGIGGGVSVLLNIALITIQLKK